MQYQKCISSPVFKEPKRNIEERYLKLDNCIKSLEYKIQDKLKHQRSNFTEIIAKLDTLSPLKTMSRGYSIVQKNGKIIKSSKDVKTGDTLNLKFIDGEKKAIVE